MSRPAHVSADGTVAAYAALRPRPRSQPAISPCSWPFASQGFAPLHPETPALRCEIRLPSHPRQPMGDTGLELASGARVGPDSPVLLGFSALRSARVRSNCYQNCYQSLAARRFGIESMTRTL